MRYVAVIVDISRAAEKPGDSIEIRRIRSQNHDRCAARSQPLETEARQEQSNQGMGQVIQSVRLARWAFL